MKVFKIGERVIDDEGYKGTIINIRNSDDIIKYYGSPMYHVSHDTKDNGYKTNTDGWYQPDKLISIDKFIPIGYNSVVKPFQVGYEKRGIPQSIIVMAHNQDDAYLYFAVNNDCNRVYPYVSQLSYPYFNDLKKRGMSVIYINYDKEYEKIGYKTVTELSRDELIELKTRYYNENSNTELSYGELVDIDSIVSDEEVFNYYSDVTFTKDDFFCNQNDENVKINDNNDEIEMPEL